MFALFSRILKLSGRYKSRIQGAFVCAFLESILSKMPIFLAFVVLSGFASKTITGQTCLYVGLGLATVVLVQMLVHYLSDSLQSAAGYLMFADKRIELGGHLRKLPMNFFNTKDLSELTTNMMADCSSMESLLSSTIPPLIANGITVTLTCILLAFFDWRLALCVFVTVPLAFLIIGNNPKSQ